jgi:uncharacterized repeat protein (TIGR03803 family)
MTIKFAPMKTRFTTLDYVNTPCAIKRDQSMKTHILNLFTCLGVASTRSRACHAEVSTRSRSCRAAASARRRLLSALAASLALILAGQAQAQTFTTLYGLTDGSDGASPCGDLLLAGNSLYGTAEYGGNVEGGSSGYGTVFALNTNGTDFTTLHSFTEPHANGPGLTPVLTNSDGFNPVGGLVVSGNTLYGTCQNGGSLGSGTVFAVNTDGTDFTVLHTFREAIGNAGVNSDGAYPWSTLLLSGNTLYGTCPGGGSAGDGTVFAIDTNGTGFTTLHSFTEAIGNAGENSTGTNSEGAFPQNELLVVSGNTLYGTAAGGGSSGTGTVFAVNTDGTGFNTLLSFAAASGTSNETGAVPWGVILSGSTLYGTCELGGSSGYGTVFAVNTDGTGFTVLHNFTATATNSDGTKTNSDGANPTAGLILSGNTLYGTAGGGGSQGTGTVFSLSTNGTGFTTLYSLTARPGFDIDGAHLEGGLLLSGNTLYGTTVNGGSFGKGVVFSLSLPPTAPQLAITLSGANVVLTWPSTATGFNLQSTASFVSPAVWSAVSPGPVVLNGQNTVTNPISGTQQFYQLSQ